MNEFIVWDVLNRVWIDDDDIVINSRGVVKVIDRPLLNTSYYDTFNYIGKTDINGKKIYAESSIVEFEYRGQEKFTGYFTYDSYNLCYMLKVGEESQRFHAYSHQNLKIIDTIQENKLGLIK